MITSLLHILYFYFLFSLLLWFINLSLNWTYHRIISQLKTDLHNQELDLELEFGFITPTERDFRFESYRTGWRMYVVGGSLCAPFYIITNIFLLSAFCYAFLVHDARPVNVLDPERAEKELEEENPKKLQEYREKLKRWKEEEFRKSDHPKYVWQKEPGVLAR